MLHTLYTTNSHRDEFKRQCLLNYFRALSAPLDELERQRLLSLYQALCKKAGER